MAAQGVFHWMQACVVLQLLFSEALPAAASQESRNYYDTLNVETSATDRQIKKAFRVLAMKYHPDRNKSADAEKTFREIVEAYTVLSNKEKRRLYDMRGHEALPKDDPDMDEHETSFHFSFADFDDSPFVDEPPFHWSFHQDGEDEDGPYEHYDFEEPGFSFYFEDENEEEPLY